MHHRAWPPICTYLTKQDQNPIVVGDHSKEQILNLAKNCRDHRMRKAEPKEGSNEIEILERLELLAENHEWYDAYDDPILRKVMLKKLPRLKEAFQDIKTKKEGEGTIYQRILNYVTEHGFPKEYDIEDLQEKYLLLDWIACNLCFERPIKTKQLFIIWGP